MAEMFILVCPHTEGRPSHRSRQLIFIDVLYGVTYLNPELANQNPENYGIKRGIPHECLERHMQGNILQVVTLLSHMLTLMKI